MRKTSHFPLKKKVKIESKWEIVKIKDICEIGRGRVISKKEIDLNSGEYPVYSSQTSDNGVFGKLNTFDFEGEYVTWTTDGIYAGSVFYRNGKFNCTNVCGTLKAKVDIINMRFLALTLPYYTQYYVVKVANPKLMNNVMAEIKIPLPPLEIQQKIVSEIEVLEEKERKAIEEIEKYKEDINALLSSLLSKSETIIRLSDTTVFESKIGKRVLKSEIKSQGKYPVYSANVFEPFGYIDKELLTDFSVPSVVWGIDGDWMVNIIDSDLPFYPTDHCGYLRIKKPVIKPRYLAFCLLREGKQIEFSRTKRASLDRIQSIKIPLPPIEDQEKIVSEIEKLEKKIIQLENQIVEIPKQREQILKTYLE